MRRVGTSWGTPLAAWGAAFLAAWIGCFAAPIAAAETIMSPVGDEDNGGGYYKSECPKGQFMIGIAARTGDWVDRMAAICGRWSKDQQKFISAESAAYFGGDGGRPQDVQCKSTSPVKGLQVWSGVSDHWVDRAAIVCGDTSTHELRNNAQQSCVDLGFFCLYKPADELTCPSGEVATGLTMRAAGYVNDVGLICEPFDKTVDSPIPDEATFYQPTLPDGTRVDACLHYQSECGQQAADRYCQLRGMAEAVPDAFQMDPHLGGYSTANGTTSTQPIGELRPCAEAFCTGFKSITCRCAPRAEKRTFEFPEVEATGTRLNFCYRGSGRSTCSPSLPPLWRSRCRRSFREKNECGQKPADLFCVQKGFLHAEAFEEDPNAGVTSPTQVIGVLNSAPCQGGGCVGFKSITCSGVLDPTTCSGLSGRTYSPCSGGMTLNDKGVCECRAPMFWIGGKCRRDPVTANVNVRLPDPARPVRFPTTIGCKPPRPVGVPPNCCPEKTFFANGICRRVATPTPTPPIKTFPPRIQPPRPRVPITVPQTSHTEQYANGGQHPMSSPPPSVRCAAGSLVKSYSACAPIRRPPAVKTSGAGGSIGAHRPHRLRCPASRPVGRPPYCCPAGTSYSGGRCHARAGGGGAVKPAAPQNTLIKSGGSQIDRYKRAHRIHEMLKRRHQSVGACCDKRNLPGCRICGLH